MSARDDKLAAALREWLRIDEPIEHPAFATLATQFRALIARHGLAVLPVEPTEKMLDAAFNADAWSQLAETYATIYRAMLAAAKEDSTDA